MAFQWHCFAPYWRATGELVSAINCQDNVDSTDANMMAQFMTADEACGYIYQTRFSYDPNDSHDDKFYSLEDDVVFQRKPLHNANDLNQQQKGKRGWKTVNHAYSYSDFPGRVPFVSPEPIPQLFLQTQPQIGSLEAGVGDSVTKVDFTIAYDFLFSGHAPRQLPIGAVLTQNATGQLTRGKAMTNKYGSNRIPVFRPVVVQWRNNTGVYAV